MDRPRFLVIAVAVATMITAASATAQVELRFSPADQRVAVGENGSLSIILDEAIDVRTLELIVSYDSTMVTSLGGQPGQLFTESGCPLFPFFDEDEPGSWYGGCVTMGPTCFLTGPGELFRWNFEGRADGICQVRVDGVAIYDPLAEVIGDVSLPGTAIFVGDSSPTGTPLAKGLTLSLAPNPFNPRTTIRFGGRPNESATVEVFDLAGRRLTTLWSGKLGPEPGVVPWDGTDRQGRSVPGGAYLFYIQGQEDRRTIKKGILLK